MNRRNILGLCAIAALSVALLPGGTLAQQKSLKEQLVGTWILVDAMDVASNGTKTPSFGTNPKGVYMFDASGHFSQMLIRSDLPKIANRGAGGTAEQNKALVTGAVAQYGTYTVNEAEKLVTVHYEGSTFAAFNGTEGKRTIASITADQMTTRNPATSTGSVAESVWRRAK